MEDNKDICEAAKKAKTTLRRKTTRLSNSLLVLLEDEKAENKVAIDCDIQRFTKLSNELSEAQDEYINVNSSDQTDTIVDEDEDYYDRVIRHVLIKIKARVSATVEKHVSIANSHTVETKLPKMRQNCGFKDLSRRL